MADEQLTSAAQAAAPNSTSAAAPAATSTETSSASQTPPAATTNTQSTTAPADTVLGDGTAADGADQNKSELSKTDKVETKIDTTQPEKKPEEKTDVKPEAKEAVKTDAQADNKTADGADKEVKQPEAEKKEEASQSDEPAPLPSFEPWTFPEGVTVDEAQVGDFNKMLGEFVNEGKVDKAIAQKFGQQLIDRHVSDVKAVAGKIAEAYDAAWKQQTIDWFSQFEKDPEIGGNRMQTTAAAAKDFIRKHGGTEEQQTEIRTILRKTGLGNYPPLIRLFANANRNLAEGEPVPASSAPSTEPAKTLKQKMYAGKPKK